MKKCIQRLSIAILMSLTFNHCQSLTMIQKAELPRLKGSPIQFALVYTEYAKNRVEFVCRKKGASSSRFDIRNKHSIMHSADIQVNFDQVRDLRDRFSKKAQSLEIRPEPVILEEVELGPVQIVKLSSGNRVRRFNPINSKAGILSPKEPWLTLLDENEKYSYVYAIVISENRRIYDRGLSYQKIVRGYRGYLLKVTKNHIDVLYAGDQDTAVNTVWLKQDCNVYKNRQETDYKVGKDIEPLILGQIAEEDAEAILELIGKASK